MPDTFVLSGKALQTAMKLQKATGGFGADIIFDRIVNVKINYEYFAQDYSAPAQSVIIRSDYEAVSGPAFVSPNVQLMKAANAITDSKLDRTPVFKKVSVKPDIRFKYVGHGNTGIECEVTIHNLFMLVEDFAKELNTNSAGIKIKSIEVLFGYMSQFPDLRLFMGLESSIYYSDFTNEIYSNVSYFKGDVLFWYRSAQPPNGAYTFKCAVTAVSMPEATTLKKLAISPVVSDAEMDVLLTKYDSYVASHGFRFVDIVAYYITKHYVKYEIMNNPLYVDNTSHELTELGASLFGIQVFVMSPKIFKTVFTDYVPFLGAFPSNAVGMLNSIKASLYPNLTYKFGLDGNVYLYDSSEHVSDYDYQLQLKVMLPAMSSYNLGIRAKVLAAEANFGGANRSDSRPLKNRVEPVIIPGVYSLQYGPLTQISCPFFGALNPGQQLQFNAAYSVAQQPAASLAVTPLTGLTNYTLLYYDIDFSSVSEYNNVNIYCVPSV